jgi:hypothetical protein
MVLAIIPPQSRDEPMSPRRNLPSRRPTYRPDQVMLEDVLRLAMMETLNAPEYAEASEACEAESLGYVIAPASSRADEF